MLHHINNLKEKGILSDYDGPGATKRWLLQLTAINKYSDDSKILITSFIDKTPVKMHVMSISEI